MPVIERVAREHPDVVQKPADPGSYEGMKLVDVARECLELGGHRVAGEPNWKIASRALSTHARGLSVSDFAMLVDSAFTVALQATYLLAPVTWPLFCGQKTVPDFRDDHTLYRLQNLDVLEEVGEGGEIPSGNLNEATPVELNPLKKHAGIISLSWESVLADSMQAFDLIGQFALAAAQTLEKRVYDFILANDNFAGGAPFFDASRGNVGTGSTLTTAAIDADAAAMERALDGTAYVARAPRVLLVPRELKGTALGAVGPSATAQPLIEKVIGSARLTGTKRFYFSDPASCPAMIVTRLPGEKTPLLDVKHDRFQERLIFRVKDLAGLSGVDPSSAYVNEGVEAEE